MSAGGIGESWQATDQLCQEIRNIVGYLEEMTMMAMEDQSEHLIMAHANGSLSYQLKSTTSTM